MLGRRRAALVGATALAALASSARPAGAQDLGGDVYDVRWPFELGVLAAAGVAWGVPTLLTPSVVHPSCPCSSDAVPGFDHVALGRHSAPAARASDVSVAALAVLPFAFDAWDVRVTGGGARVYVTDGIVQLEVLAVTTAVTSAVKVAVRRPRPLLYDAAPGDPALTVADNYLSFFSGHTSTAFAAGIGYASTFALRHTDSAWRAPIFGAAVAAGAGVGTLRVLAGKHFPTDVIAGAAAGTGAGLLLPRIHRRSGTSAIIVPLPSAAGLAVVGTY